jgi:hypothetical protein
MKVGQSTAVVLIALAFGSAEAKALSSEQIERLDVCPGYAEFKAAKKFFPDRKDLSHAEAGNLIQTNPKAQAYGAHLYKWCLKHYREIKW